MKKPILFRNKTFRSLMLSLVLILLTGTLVYHYVEGWRWFDSLYFSVISLTTVGYGDFSPQTDFGKAFTMFYVLSGIGVIFGFINAFYKQRALMSKKILEKKEAE